MDHWGPAGGRAWALWGTDGPGGGGGGCNPGKDKSARPDRPESDQYGGSGEGKKGFLWHLSAGAGTM